MAFFTPGQVDLNENKTLIPEGSYIVEILVADEVIKAWGTGCLLKYKVVYPVEQHGMTVGEILCIGHSKPDTQRIANQKMERTCQAINKKDPINSPQELIGCNLKLDIVHKPHYKNAGELQEEIKYRSALNKADLALLPEVARLIKVKEKREQDDLNAKKKLERQVVSDEDIPF